MTTTMHKLRLVFVPIERDERKKWQGARTSATAQCSCGWMSGRFAKPAGAIMSARHHATTLEEKRRAAGL